MKHRKKLTAKQVAEKKRLSAPTLRANTGYGQRQVERPDQLSKPSAAELKKWERKLPRLIE